MATVVNRSIVNPHHTTTPSLPAPVLFLASYSGQSPDELLALESTHRIDSLVLAFEQALEQKAAGKPDRLTEVERDVLAVEALEREVNNGGYSQFFVNSSAEHVPQIVGALERIGCPITAGVTRRAIAALRLGPAPGVAEIDRVLQRVDSAQRKEWQECDVAYFDSGENLAGLLFAYLKVNRAAVTFR